MGLAAQGQRELPNGCLPASRHEATSPLQPSSLSCATQQLVSDLGHSLPNSRIDYLH